MKGMGGMQRNCSNIVEGVAVSMALLAWDVLLCISAFLKMQRIYIFAWQGTNEH